MRQIFRQIDNHTLVHLYRQYDFKIMVLSLSDDITFTKYLNFNKKKSKMLKVHKDVGFLKNVRISKKYKDFGCVHGLSFEWEFGQ